MKMPKEQGGHRDSAFDAARRAVRADPDLGILSQAERAALAAQLTTLLARVERVRALGPAYAGVEASEDVRELLMRLEAGSSLATGVH
jgi:hypothetical protein